MTQPQDRRAVTFVATLDVIAGDAQRRFEEALRDLIEDHGLVLLPCGWTPDPDTILGATPDADCLAVVDMNSAPR